MLTDQLERIRYGGDEAFVKRLSIRGLMPDTDHYMTYDGSTTAPACHETVTWVVLNKPIYITKQQVSDSSIEMGTLSGLLHHILHMSCIIGDEINVVLILVLIIIPTMIFKIEIHILYHYVIIM